MKRKLLGQIWYLTKLLFYGTVIQCFMLSILFATDINALKKSIDNIHLDIDLKNSSIKNAFKVLEKETGLYFTYSDISIDQNIIIDYSTEDASLRDVLSYLAKEYNLQFRRVNETVNVSKKSSFHEAVTETITSLNQTREVTGKVTGDDGEVLPGASIIVKGTSDGTVTDLEGNYSISVPGEETILSFSYVGFEGVEVQVGNQSVIDIEMKVNAESLSEVVVTALGINKELKSIGYATQKVKGAVLTQANTTNLGNMLTGQVAGLTVKNPTGMFQAPSFVLRGNKPLIVIDGIIVETDLYDVSANDIESINVLKGTAASALYGSRGKDGAILITTKLAKTEGLTISVNHATMVTAGYTVFPESQTEYGNGSNGKYEFWDGKDGGVSDGDMIWGPKFEPGVMVKQWNSPILDNVTGNQIPWWGDVSGTQYDDKSRYSRVPTPWEYHNNLKDFMGTGVQTSTDFEVAYKSEKVNYRLSGKYAYQEGQVPNTSLTTGGLSFNSSIKLTNKLTLDTKLAYNKVYSPNFPRHGYGPRNHMYTILIWMGDDVNGKDLNAHRYIPGQEGYRQANFNYAWYNNVYFAAYELNQVHDSNVLNGLMSLNWQLTDDFSIQGRVSAINRSTFADRQSPKSYLNYGDPREGDYKIWNTGRLRVDSDILMTYNKKINSNLVLNINAGASSFYRKFHEEYTATDGLIVPFVYSLNNTQGNVKASNYLEKEAIRSVYTTISVDLYDALFLNVAARNDWSSTLPKENSSFFYPSASASLLLSRFLNLPDVFDFLKVSSAWAEVSSGLDPYQISPFYNNNGLYGVSTKLTYSGGIINPYIAPEKSTSFEVGLSTSFWQKRMSFDFTYYNILDENQIINLPISPASGFNSRKVNGNEFKTNGVEIVLGANPIRSDNFRWDFLINWSRRVRTLASIYGGEEKFGNYSVGERMDNYYGTGWMYSADGQLILSESNGLPTRDSYPQMKGHLDPNWVFGFQNNLNYKKFKLEIGIDGVKGGVMRSRSVEKMWWGGKHPNSTEFRDEEYAAGVPVYTPEGVNVTGGELTRDTDGTVISDTREYKPNTTKVSWQTWGQQYPYRARVSYKESKKFANIFDRSFIKLRSVTLSYDLTSAINSNFIKKFEVAVYGYNLLIIKKADIIDPDFGNDNSLQDPSARYLGMRFNLTF